MDRRESLKVFALTAFASGVLVEACKSDTKKKVVEDGKNGATLNFDRQPYEQAAHEKNLAETFFTPHEMATITVLADIIIPKDEVSGSATDAKVPEFIEYIVKDKPNNQVPMRGGLRWLDMQCLKQFSKSFVDCSAAEQIKMIDQVAYPKKAKPEMMQGVSFFSLIRNLVTTGFYTTEIGVKDVGYMGNTPNRWNGVPDDVLKQYGLAYTEKELKECISFS
jgi:gluconate 2-dehydrogenase gamma chain